MRAGAGRLLAPLPFSDDEYKRRLAATRAHMQKEDLDFLLLFTPENIYYLTGHDTPGYYYLQVCIVSHDQPPIILTRKIESFNTLGRSWARLVCPYQDTQDPIGVLVALLSELGYENKSVGFESTAWFINSEQYLSLTEHISNYARPIPVKGLVERQRAVKSGEELKYIREGGRICSAAMHVAFQSSREGVSENDVAAATIGELIRLGGEYAGLPPFISTGTRTALVHSTWSGRKLCNGDVLAYELPGVRARYCAALYRTGFVGDPPSEIRKGADVILETVGELIAAIRPGRAISDVHKVSVNVFEKHGVPASPRRSAYSLGINYPPDWGEGHILSFTDDEDRPLEAGMVFHVGVGIFEYPKYQLAFTETVIVTEHGNELATDFPSELTLC